MKKTVIACALALLSLNATALPFDGFYIGGVVGGTKAKVSNNENTDELIIVAGTEIQHISQDSAGNYADSSWIGGPELGFGMVFAQHYYLGLEGVAQFESIESKRSSTVLPTPATNIVYNHSTQAKLSNELAVTFNPGIVINKTTLLYGKIGPTWGRFSSSGALDFREDFQGQGIAGNQVNFDEDAAYKVGLRLGLGIEHYFMDHLSLKLEYLNSNYGQINSGKVHSAPVLLNGVVDPIAAGSMGSIQDKLRFRNNTVMLGFNYHFGA